MSGNLNANNINSKNITTVNLNVATINGKPFNNGQSCGYYKRCDECEGDTNTCECCGEDDCNDNAFVPDECDCYVPCITPSSGVTGPQGPQGYNGSNGIQGFTGADGIQGPQGSNGIDGPQGLKGETGSNGIDGSQGPTGPQGSEGPMGGPTGPTGQSQTLAQTLAIGNNAGLTGINMNSHPISNVPSLSNTNSITITPGTNTNLTLDNSSGSGVLSFLTSNTGATGSGSGLLLTGNTIFGTIGSDGLTPTTKYLALTINGTVYKILLYT